MIETNYLTMYAEFLINNLGKNIGLTIFILTLYALAFAFYKYATR